MTTSLQKRQPSPPTLVPTNARSAAVLGQTTARSALALVLAVAQPFLLAIVLSVATAGDGDARPAQAESIMRTGDPYARGYTDADFPRVQQIGDGVYTYEQLRAAGEERFTTVSMFVVTSEGVLVADGQGNVEETERLLAHIAEITALPITDVVIGSDHGDHTGGNSAFPENARYWAHPTSAAVLASNAARAAEREGAPPVRLATDLVAESAVLQLGDKTIILRFLGRAHTGGDLTVYLPDEKILFMSEAYLNRIFPAMRSAYPSEWVAMIEAAQAMDVNVYVPGHGFVDSPEVLTEELESYRRALLQVIDEGKRLYAAGLSIDNAVQQAQFGDLETWTLRASQAPTAIRRVYMELNGELNQ